MTKNELVRKLEREGILKTPAIKKALIEIDRVNYVPKELRNSAYQDIPLPIGEEQTISQPGTVIFMLELLQPSEGNRILEIGGGSGWVTALLSRLVGDKGFVYSFEINPAVGKFGLANLKENRLKNFRYSVGDAKVHWTEFAPYDKIISGAAFPLMYGEMDDLLKKGGTMVIPTKDFSLKRITKSPNTGNLNLETYYGYVFVPLK